MLGVLFVGSTVLALVRLKAEEREVREWVDEDKHEKRERNGEYSR